MSQRDAFIYYMIYKVVPPAKTLVEWAKGKDAYLENRTLQEAYAYWAEKRIAMLASQR